MVVAEPDWLPVLVVVVLLLSSLQQSWAQEVSLAGDAIVMSAWIRRVFWRGRMRFLQVCLRFGS